MTLIVLINKNRNAEKIERKKELFTIGIYKTFQFSSCKFLSLVIPKFLTISQSETPLFWHFTFMFIYYCKSEVTGFVNLWSMDCQSFVLLDYIRLGLVQAPVQTEICFVLTFDAMIVRKEKLGGVSWTAKIDESKFEKEKYHREH